jgi:hypothetical protein
MPDDDLKPNLPDSSEAERLLELELMQKRAMWQQTKARRGTLRVLSFLFLFVVVLIALLVFFWFLSPERIGELKTGRSEEAQPSPVPSPN